MRGNARRVTIAIILSATAVAEAQPARELARLREDLELLRGAIGAMSGEVGDRDAQLAELEQRVAELSQRAMATEAVARAQTTDNAVLVQQQQLAAQVEALRAELAAFVDTPAPSQVDHVDGFVWTTDDEEYQLRLGGYLQGRFSVDSRGSEQDSGFTLRRTRLVIDGTGEVGLGFRLATELVPDPALVDAWLQLTKGRVAVRAGRDRVPFGRSLLVPENQLPFPEVPVATEALAWGRDLGAQVRVDTMRFLVTTIAVMNGGPEGAAQDDFPLVALRNEIGFGRVASDPEDALVKGRSVGFGFGFVIDQLEVPAMVGDIALVPDRDGDGAADRLGVMAYGADLTVRRDGFQLAAEVMARVEMWGDLPMQDPALAMLLGSTQPLQTRVAASLDLTQMIGRTVMFGTRLAGGELPVFSLRGPSAVPPADKAVELDAVLGFHRKAKRVFTLGYRFLQYGHTLFGRDGGRVHTVTAEAQLEL